MQAGCLRISVSMSSYYCTKRIWKKLVLTPGLRLQEQGEGPYPPWMEVRIDRKVSLRRASALALEAQKAMIATLTPVSTLMSLTGLCSEDLLQTRCTAAAVSP